MKLTIVMYHYVRCLKESKFPRINGLDKELFIEQVRYLKKYYNVISADVLLNAITSDSGLPPRSVLLTFDDGYTDHFSEVFPVLRKEKLSGCFFPPAKPVLENAILDVNKIHFINASTPDEKLLAEYIFKALDEYRVTFSLESNDFYWKKCGIQNRYDSAEVSFVKRMLQRDLPKELRQIITDQLFEKFVSVDMKAFSQELYMNKDQITYLQDNGMYVGSHGYEHSWLNSISVDEQRKEIQLSLQFLESVGSDTDRWIMCYPYGGYDESLLSLLKETNCKAGFTTQVELADLAKNDPLTLPRLDTNDLPKDSKSAPSIWTQKIINTENNSEKLYEYKK